MTARDDFRAGARAAIPIVLGYLSIGLAYGVLGVAAGVPGWAVVSMSVLVFAGSAQLVAVSLLGQGAGAGELVAAALLLNLRHILYASALAPLLEPMTRGRLAWVAYELTDETFVVATQAAKQRGRLSFPFEVGLNGISQLSWVGGSVLGVVAGSFVGDPERLGLDYALIAMFLGLLALQMRGRREVVVALAAAAISTVLWLMGLGSTGALVATVVVASVGAIIRPGTGPDLPTHVGTATDGGPGTEPGP
jgi:4-azaleucine resistance transporter AzlC